MQIIKTHQEIFRFILKEIKTTKTFQERIKVGKNLVTSYISFWGQEIKLIKAFICDKDYRSSLKKKKRQDILRKEFYRALQLLDFLDKKMDKMGIGRTARRQFWRDFQKHQTIRKEAFDELLKEVEK